jgi:hypothetical protein
MNLPQIQPPDYGPDLGTLATGAAQRRLLRERTEALRLANEQRKLDMQAEAERRKAAMNPPAMVVPASVSPMPVQGNLNTNDMANGRFWNDLAANQKSIYITGLADGLSHAQGLHHGEADVWNSYPLGLANGEIAKALDRFYDTPENVQIPVAWALAICRQRLHGEAESEVQNHILSFRQ